MEKRDTLELETRKKIHHYILKYPGLHFRELMRKLNLPNGTLGYHLQYLEKRGLITTKSEDGYVRYYIINNIGNDQKKMIHILRQEVPRNIILYLLWQSCASQIELSKSLEKHPTTIEIHLKKLLNRNIVERAPVDTEGVHVEFLGPVKIVDRAPVGKEIIYRLKNPYSTYHSVILYKKRSLNDNFCDILSVGYKFSSWCLSGVRKTKIKSYKDILESFEEGIYEVFPHPYHA